MRRLKTLVIALVALAVLVVGGTFVYINFIQDDAPEKLSLESSTADPAPADSGDVSGTWKATTGSQAGYRVDEVLFGQNTTAAGRTSDVTGQLVIDGTTVTTTKVVVDMTTVKSDQDRRDQQFQGRVMDTKTYPTATFELTKPIELGTLPAAGTTVTKQATGKLTLHGTTKEVTIDLTSRRNGSKIEVQGSVPIVFDEWGIPNPTFGPVTTEDHGELEFLVAFAR
jgi:polyisoprenoid-binding protein YceI